MEFDLDELELRADRFLSATPRPFVKWAGSKRWLLSQLVRVLPSRADTYWEPFLGSGALFFLLQPRRARLSDSCPELMQAFAAVRDDSTSVLRQLGRLRVGKSHFYRVRSHRSQAPFRRAAEFIYLNRLCWNGLYRVNADGVFNVPYGKPRTKFLVDSENLRACSDALRAPGIRLGIGDFELALEGVQRGDLVYLDPPYVTSHNNNGFIEYNRSLFGWDDQVRLAKVARRLARIGATVIVTNAHHDSVRRLYGGFHMMTVHRESTLANDVKRRARTSEVVLVS